MWRSYPIARIAIPSFGAGALVGTLSGMLIWNRNDVPNPAPILKQTLSEQSIHYPAGFPLPSSGKVVSRESFTTSINYYTRTPDWVAEKITSAQLDAKNGERDKAGFKEDKDIPINYRATNADYWNSGWSRGHLAASASHRHNQAAQNDTFLLNSNIVPQDLSMNGCDWNRLEVLVRDLAKQYKSGTVYVVSGPLWISEESTPYSQRPFSKNKVLMHEVIGRTGVHVPTHMFKIIKVEDKDLNASAAFVMPNRPINDDHPLEYYQVQADYIEKIAGLDFSGMTTQADLCSVTKCDRSSNKRMVGWRHYGYIDQSLNIDELRTATRNAIDAGYVSEDNFLIPKIIRDRMRDLGIMNDTLFPDEPRYQSAVDTGFKTFERKSKVETGDS